MLRTVPAVPYNGLSSSFLDGGGSFSFPPVGGVSFPLLAPGGSAAAPSYSFAGATDYGIYLESGTQLRFITGGIPKLVMWTNGALVPAGTAAAPSLSDLSDTSAGLFWPGGGIVAMSAQSVENTRWAPGGIAQHSKGSADAVSYAINARKARGTVASPTVITTGDDLLTISGYGYKGATNTYGEAAAIRFGATSTVTDSANGLGGVIDVRAQLSGSGTSTLPTIFRFSGTTKHAVHMGTVPAITANGGTNPSLVGTDQSFVITVGSGGIASSVTVTFGRPWTNIPQCVANHQGAILVLRCVPTLSTVVIDAATPFTAGGLIDVICSGYE